VSVARFNWDREEGEDKHQISNDGGMEEGEIVGRCGLIPKDNSVSVFCLPSDL
jgi:hypothetical protein